MKKAGMLYSVIRMRMLLPHLSENEIGLEETMTLEMDLVTESTQAILNLSDFRRG